MSENLLIFSDPESSYRDRFIENAERIFGDKKYENISYEDLERKDYSHVKLEDASVLLLYPNRKRDEIKKNIGEEIYGGHKFGEEMDKYWIFVGEKIEDVFGENIRFVNSPEGIIRSRDKKKFKETMISNGLPTPPFIDVSYVEDIVNLVDNGVDIFSKPRYGGYGREITFLSEYGWYTGFGWDGNDLYYIEDTERDTKFLNVTDDIAFLDKLVKLYKMGDIIFEKAIDYQMIDGKKFDLRMYVVYGEVAHILPRTNDPEKIVTNWSRGGKIEPEEFLNKIPKYALEMANENAVRAAEALGTNFIGLDVIFSKDFEEAYLLEGQTDAGMPRKERFDMVKYLVEKIKEKG